MANLEKPRQIAGFASTPGRWKSYPAYKPSGVDWLGPTPSHWVIKRLKYVAPVVPERLADKPDELLYIGLEHVESATGRLLLDTPVEDVDSTVACFQEGDVLFGKLRPYLAKVANPDFNGVCSSELLVLRPASDVASRYVFYQLLSRDVIQLITSFTYGTKMPRVSPEQIASLSVALPPFPEQQVIAAFLDRETAKIDALVAKKERLIELLQEKRAALITHAVTKGLNPSAPMKDSGVRWLGQIPSHWDSCRLRAVTVSLQTGPFGSQLHAEEYVTGGIPVINPANLKHGGIEADDESGVDERTRERLSRHVITEGDIVFARRGEMGRYGLATADQAGWLCGTGSLKVRLDRSVADPGFVSRVLGTTRTRDWLTLESVGATMENLNTGIVGRIPLTLPPLREQQEIAAWLGNKVSKIDELVRKVQEHMQKLREYRAAVISAAVTGKIDVRQETV